MLAIYWGLSPSCFVDICDECERPNECDCDCHLEDPPDGFPMYDQDFPGGW